MAKPMNQIDPNDANAIMEFALGPMDCAAGLVPQQRGKLPEIHQIYHDSKRSFVVKKAGIGGRDDWRCFDAHTGRKIYNSHHPGKDPYEKLDPLGLKQGPAGGEWESVCDVSGHNGGFKIRPKKMSMHGRQYIKLRDKAVLSVAKMSKLKTMSLAPSFQVSIEEDSGMVMGMGAGSKQGDVVMTISSDMVARTIQFYNNNNELVAIAQKPPKTLFLNAAFGCGTEMQMEIAPGVDCTLILATFLALQQCGEHILKDAFGNFVVDPMQDEAMGQVTDMVPGGQQAVGQYNQMQQQATSGFNKFNKLQQMMKQ
eukprot:TRINITY_DN3087_c0_g1_i12.p1 TRINITY_DN3087_c0_g1~~TRINITY_DN3087_c0_g1_i12.p1  ORF type:complete len:337 (+),score=141.84 TRINITY_DN3087_c0_g1_i12:80-1012(+)